MKLYTHKLNVIFTTRYSIRSYCTNTHISFTPVAIYENVQVQKTLILKNKNKVGVYRWINKINNKSYVGSSINLGKRFHVYFSTKRLINSNMIIYKSVLKYGYSKFKLEILEYCESDIVNKREQYFIDILKPEYNILTTVGSSFGYKHSEETLRKFRLRKVSDETRASLAKAATGRKLSIDIRAKISAARKGIKVSKQTRAKLSAATTTIQGVGVEITNIKTKEIKKYLTLTEAASALGVTRTTIKNKIKSGKIFRNIYIIKQNKSTLFVNG